MIRLPGEGETTSLFGGTYTDEAVGEETGWTLAAIEADLLPQSGGTPLPVNTLEDENYYATEGTLMFRLGERNVKAPAGPPSSCVPAPAGFERFFADLAGLMAKMRLARRT